jgi:hypothetical protein
MKAVMVRAAERKFAGIRLVQAAYHNRSLSLYAKLGFVVREPLSCMQGQAIHNTVSGYGGGVTAYASSVAFFGHAVGETNEALEALIAAAPAFHGSGILIPTRNAGLFRWCLESGLRVVQTMTLMTMGLYNEPAGAYLPPFCSSSSLKRLGGGESHRPSFISKQVERPSPVASDAGCQRFPSPPTAPGPAMIASHIHRQAPYRALQCAPRAKWNYISRFAEGVNQRRVDYTERDFFHVNKGSFPRPRIFLDTEL